MPVQNLNKNYGKTNKNMQKVCETQLKISLSIKEINAIKEIKDY